jgi:alkanesulfonate monooxygenase SsuD/methylene tetrahydromethanopterin reductase-like flavin-dependent oxidoreductase (luciferase family)
MPIVFRAGALREGLADLHQRARAAGRDPKSISVSVFWAQAEADALRSYEEAGVERVIFPVPPEGKDKVLSVLDRYAKFIR